MRFVFRQDRADSAQHAVHFGLGFANGQAADGQAGEVELFQTFQRFFTQIFIHRALYNAKQRIWVFQVFKSLFTAFCPAQAHLQRFLRLAVRCFARGAFVQLHHDVGIQYGLDFHRHFGRKEQFVAVDRALECTAFFGQLAHVGQREYLEAARVGQNRLIPTDKFVQAAELFDDFQTGAQPQMVSVA